MQPVRILYAVQGTGNGHVARAREIIPVLQKYGKVDVVLSGDQSQVDLPVKLKYRNKGLTFIYNKKGGISYWKTLRKNNFIKIFKEVRNFPVSDYDIIINDFEFITAWACKLRGKKCFGLGHQASFVYPETPRPEKREWIGELILKHYAPCTQYTGFHFDTFNPHVFPPVIRSEIRNLQAANLGHYTVYLPAFGDEQVYRFLSNFPEKEWQVFSKRIHKPCQRDHVKFFPVSNEGFVKSFLKCEGVLTSAGFETPAEAMFLGKKVMVIPIKGQYEQFCNAAAIQTLGVPVIFDLKEKNITEVRQWLQSGKPVTLFFPDQTEQIIRDEIIKSFWQMVPGPGTENN